MVQNKSLFFIELLSSLTRKKKKIYTYMYNSIILLYSGN